MAGNFLGPSFIVDHHWTLFSYSQRPRPVFRPTTSKAMFPCITTERINRIVAMQGHLTPKERRAAIRLIVAETTLEAERARYAGGGGYDRATRLMRPLLFLRESRRAYNCFLRETTVRVDPKKKCFVIRKSPPAVPGCRNKINKKGDLTIGFGYGRSPRLPATLAQAKKTWKQVITVLSITDNDLRCMAAETDEEQLFGSDHEGSVHSDSSGYSDMPPLMPAWPTVESLRDEPTNSTDEEPSSTDSEAEAIEVNYGRKAAPPKHGRKAAISRSPKFATPPGYAGYGRQQHR